MNTLITRLDNARIENVIVVEGLEGTGTVDEPAKKILIFYTLSGEFIGKLPCFTI